MDWNIQSQIPRWIELSFERVVLNKLFAPTLACISRCTVQRWNTKCCHKKGKAVKNEETIFVSPKVTGCLSFDLANGHTKDLKQDGAVDHQAILMELCTIRPFCPFKVFFRYAEGFGKSARMEGWSLLIVHSRKIHFFYIPFYTLQRQAYSSFGWRWCACDAVALMDLAWLSERSRDSKSRTSLIHQSTYDGRRNFEISTTVEFDAWPPVRHQTGAICVKGAYPWEALITKDCRKREGLISIFQL